MKHLFYLIGVFFIIHEFLWILNPVEKVKKSKLFSELSKKEKGKKWNDFSKEYKDILIYRGLPSLLYLFYFTIGLFTFNWPAFLAFLIWSLVVIYPLSKIFRFNNIYVCIHWANSVIGLVFGIFVILNSYHLKIDLFNWVKCILNVCQRSAAMRRAGIFTGIVLLKTSFPVSVICQPKTDFPPGA